MQTSNRSLLKKTKLWVIKIGSSILTDSQGKPDPKVFSRLAKEVAFLHQEGKQVILVSSGAIACGMHLMKLQKKPSLISQKQAIAAAGQIALMNLYEKAFAKHQLKIAQILLTREDLAHRERYLNTRHALHELLHYGLIPIINENDTVAVDEIKFGDNDNLSALVTNVAEADLLVILTDQEGLYTEDPRRNAAAQKISQLENIDENIRAYAQDTQGRGTTGGMITKLEAAQKAALFGVPTLIASGRRAGVLKELVSAQETGTLVLPKLNEARLNRRKHWIVYSLKSLGKLIVDSGAREVLTQKGKSLLPSGVQKVVGRFEKGDAVEVCLSDEIPFAKGLVSYSSLELDKVKGLKSSEIEKVLGYKYSEEIIHRDDLVILKE